MDALHKALSKIHADPTNPTSAALKSLIESLDSGQNFDVSRLYALGYSDFGLALELMRQWRLDSFRYERGWATKVASDTAEFSKTPAWINTGHPRKLHS
jgi:hypothetical protein